MKVRIYMAVVTEGSPMPALSLPADADRYEAMAEMLARQLAHGYEAHQQQKKVVH